MLAELDILLGTYGEVRYEADAMQLRCSYRNERDPNQGLFLKTKRAACVDGSSSSTAIIVRMQMTLAPSSTMAACDGHFFCSENGSSGRSGLLAQGSSLAQGGRGSLAMPSIVPGKRVCVAFLSLGICLA